MSIKQNGFTLIEIIVATAVIVILAVSLFGLFGQVLKFIQIKKIQALAAHLATEQMELIHNLDYDNIGTMGGIPTGVLHPWQTIRRGYVDFLVQTNIRYIDDAYDGILGGNPTDTLNTDYKQIKITISWDTIWDAGSMFFLTNIAPLGIETAAGGGTLKVNVFDANGIAVPQAMVDIINLNTAVNINTLTNDNGLIILPGTPVDIEGYQITVNKTGYSQSQTYGFNEPEGNIAPNPARLSIFEEQTTEASFAIDKVSSLIVNTQTDQSPNPPAPFSVGFSIYGSKIIGRDIGNNPIYKYSNTASTSMQGTETFNFLEWDAYTIEFNEAAIGYNLIQYDPPTNPIGILPDINANVTFLFKAPYSPYSLLVTVIDVNNDPVSGATIHLVQPVISYDETLTVGLTGQVFFGNLNNLTYELTISKIGYNDIIVNITIQGNEEEKLQML